MKSIGLISDKKSKKLFLLPQEVLALTKEGIRVVIPANYGQGLNVSDELYKQAGANILASNAEIMVDCDVICKCNAFDKKELKALGNKIAVTMANYLANVPMLYHMIEHNVTGLAWNNLQNDKGYVFFPEIETLKAQFAVSAIADGMKKGLAKPKEKVIYPTPAELLILNATYAGVEAAKIALAKGFNVTILDNDQQYLRDLINDDDIRDITSKHNTKLDIGSADFTNLENQIAKFNAFINTSIDPVNRTKLRITKEMANSMPIGSILYDAGSEYGYAFAWIKKFAPADFTYTRFNKVFYVTSKDMTEFFPEQYSKIISRNSVKYLTELAKEGLGSPSITGIIICNKGKVVDKNVKTQLTLY